jgi:1-acyl-sn-glycerol-3-phosphate acyltransferase
MFTTLSPEQARPLVPAWLTEKVTGNTATTAGVRVALSALVEEMSDEEIAAGLAQLEQVGDGYEIFEANPFARRLSRAYLPPLIAGSELRGGERLARLAGQPQVWVGNHLSYVDTQATDALLASEGLAEAVDRMVVVAGPKVYSEPFRRLAAMGLNTLKTPQSTQLATNTAELSPREVAALAIQCVKRAEAWRAEGGPVLIYPEGTRSRSGRMGPFLRAVARYVRAAPGLWVVPVALYGTERLFPTDERMYPGPIGLSIGEPFLATDAGREKTAALEEARRRLIEALPAPYRPAAGDPTLA